MRNKIVIPTILTATVLVAGMFAAMPVYKAQTIHTGLSVEHGDILAAVGGGSTGAALTAHDTNIDGDVAANAAAIAALQADVDALEVEVGELDAECASLAATLNGLDIDIDAADDVVDAACV